jgi:Membrane protein involved in the export of O-antigen and teichoic acid
MSTGPNAATLTRGRLLARNSVLSISGQVGPLVVAVFAVPILVRSLGVERFGILTLAWAAIGYFSLFDLGLGRALTQSLSAAIGGGRTDQLPSLTIAALAAMAILGIVGAGVFGVATPWIVDRALEIPIALRQETLTAFYLLCLSLPFVLATAGLRSLFEAHQQFGTSTALRVPYAIFNFVAPLAVLPFSHSLVPVVAILVIGRMIACLAHWIVARYRFPFLRTRVVIDRQVLLPLFKTGGWMTVSNIISPLMVNFDRFVVGGLLSVTAVAYYATPYDMVMKLLLVPGALLGVLFPAFASSFEHDRSATAQLLDRTLRWMLLVIFPPVLLLVAFAHEGMRLWLGADFATHSAVVVRWLAAGVLINSVGQIAFAVVQGVGRADLTAKLHVVELPIYAVALVALTKTMGLTGVAIAWTLRVTIDTTILLVLSARRVPQAQHHLWRSVRVIGVLLAALIVVGATQSLSLRILVTAGALAAFVAVGWLQLLRSDERTALLGGLRALT